MNPQDATNNSGQLNDANSSSDQGGPVNSLPADTQTPDSGSSQPYKEITLPSGAEDSDLIEKEWVERAKEIVEHTKDDPYEQQRALSHMKADYLKKRYNKDIKVSDD